MRPAILWLAAAVPIIGAVCEPAPALALGNKDKLPASTRIVLENGFEAILIPNHAAPLVTSVVVVRAGSARETAAVNGVSHMLEHLLFNGTARRTQEQIYDEFDHYGIINNAHTGTDQTAYFVMATRDRLGFALDLQADMLFGSIFPEDKLAKERDIIINEIAKDRTSDETAMSELYAARLYHPGGLELPVTGTPESVKGITRDAILAYYRAWYVPDNMTAVIMGDFDPEEMAPLVRRYFGAAAPGLLFPLISPMTRGSVNAPALGLTHARRAAGTQRLLWMGAAAPPIDATGAFERAWILASLLDNDLARAVNARLAASGAKGALLDAAVSLDPHAQVSTFQVRASLDPSLGWADASRALLDEITGRLSAADWKGADLDRIRLAEKSSLMRLWEKPHYFGMDRAPYIAAAGWDFARDLAKRMSWVELGDLKDLSRKLADRKAWGVFRAGGDAPEDAGAVSIGGAHPDVGPGEPDKPTPQSRDLVSGWKGPRASAADSSASATLVVRPASEPSGPVNVRAVLTNGLHISLDWSDDSRVFAAHVLIKNRSAAEPAGRNGIVELLHRIAGAGTRRHPGTALDAALRSIGGTLKVTDDPGIPYDDIYLSPEYSYIRLESLDEFAPQALELLREILSEPALDDEKAISTAREQLLARARVSQASPRERSRQLLARALWGETHPFALPLFGTEQTIRSITQADLKAFHATYFFPRNIIVGIGTPLRPEAMMPLLESKLGSWTTTAARGPQAAPAPLSIAPEDKERSIMPPADALADPRSVTETVEAPQACLRLGRLASAGSNNEAVLRALAAVLTRRMGDTLREKRGLAYTLGADASLLADRFQFTASMDVLPEKVEEARLGLRDSLTSLITAPPGAREVEDAEVSAEVRLLMRNLSRINRAYARCIEELRRSQAPARSDLPPTRTTGGGFEGARSVTADQVAAAARRLLDPQGLADWIEAVVQPTVAQAGP